MTGYKRVSVLLNYVFLVLLLQPWVSFIIPSVNIPVSQDCSPGPGVTAPSVVVLFVGRHCTGKILFSFLGSWLSGQLTVLQTLNLLLTRFVSRAD